MAYLSQCPTDTGCGKTFPTDLGDCPHCGLYESFTESAQVDGRLYGYDLETYPNCFTARFIHIATGQRWKFEISTRLDQLQELVSFIYSLRACGGIGVGFNNVAFDYPVLHYIMSVAGVTVETIYDHAQRIINSMNKGRVFDFTIWERDRLFPQVDLFKIHHFDNKAKMTSLKALEICMNMDSVEDLPFPVGTVLTHEQMDILHEYNEHDVHATCMFWARTVDMIALRQRMSEKFGKDFTNMSDVKMGKQVLIIEMAKKGIECFERVNGKRVKKQTWRAQIALGDVIFPYVKFERSEFEQVRAFLANQVITETKGGFKGLHATVDGLKYAFGTGGLHASVESTSIHSVESMQIVDVDVVSFYPRMGMVNKLYPKHLGVEFCDAYLDLYHTRQEYPKKTHPMENGTYKLALNGAYGESNNEHSPFYDPFYTMSITINGQLMLCMLVEQLIKIPNLSMIQANTDGVTFYCPTQYLDHMRSVCKWWETLTCLELEEALYDSMYIRDVNSYMAVYESGDVKRIGCYAHETAEEKAGTREVPYSKDWSALVVPKAAEAALVRGEDIRTFITNHPIDRDFYMRAKVPRNSTLVMRWPDLDDYEQELANIVRYYVSKDGGRLFKRSPPTGVEGSWKKKNKVTKEVFEAISNELLDQVAFADAGGMIHMDGDNWVDTETGELVYECDSLGVPWDERIHTGTRAKHVERVMGITVGWNCTDCSDITNFDRSTVDYEYYIQEAEKIVNPLLTDTSK